MRQEEVMQSEPEVVQLEKKIYERKYEKRLLETTLRNEEIRYKYSAKRKEVTYRESFKLIALTIAIVLCLVWLILALLSGSDNLGFLVLFLGVVVVIGGKFCITRWPYEIERFRIHYFNRKNGSGRETEKPEYISEEQILEGKISSLRTQIEEIDNEIVALSMKQKEAETLLAEKLHETSDTNDNDQTKYKFTIREESLGEMEILEVIECYSREIQVLKSDIHQYEKEIDNINRKIVSIDDNFEAAKWKVIVLTLFFILYAIAQNIFSGAIYTLLSVVGLLGWSIAILYITSRIQDPVTEYLIEHDNKLTRDYVFRNNVVTFARQRNEKLAEIERCGEEIKQIEYRRQIVEGYLE